MDNLFSYEFLYLIPLGIFLFKIYLHDVKYQQISDLDVFFLVIIISLKNGVELQFIINNMTNIFLSLGATYFLKVLIENIIFYLSKNFEDFEFGDGDILLIGVLGSLFDFFGYTIFLYATFLLWLGYILVKINLNKRKGINNYIKTAFAPFIIFGFGLVFSFV